MTILARIDELIDDPKFVSGQQKTAIRFPGNFFLLSRPGSGKTRTIGIRLARLAAQPQPNRIAATSYTNIALGQINDAVRSVGAVLGPQHFTGTLHQLLLDFILYPFGHLLPVKLKQPFQIVSDQDWAGWQTVIYKRDIRKRLSIAKLHYQTDGSFKVYSDPWKSGITKLAAETEEIQQVKRLKKQARERGLISFSDALFYAMKILETHPSICAAIASRFDEIIVDEVQDTSDVQIRCLELLHRSGCLHSLVLVGDLDQSIYGFQGAQPSLCQSLASKCDLTELQLTKNYRSSQAICDVTCRFCGRLKPDQAIGHNAKAGIRPELLIYKSANPSSAVEILRARLSYHGIADDQSVVLARARKFRDVINGRRDVPGISKTVEALAEFVSSHRNGGVMDRAVLYRVEDEIADMAWGGRPIGDEQQQVQLRNAVMSLLCCLPEFECTLADWIDGARTVVTSTVLSLANPPARKPAHYIRKMNSHKHLRTTDMLGSQFAFPWARTVHDVKGESHDAVMLVVEPRKKTEDQAELWAAPLVGRKVASDDEEELRIVYVALTRAKRYCAIALPDSVPQVAIDPYLGVGFVRIDQDSAYSF